MIYQCFNQTLWVPANGVEHSKKLICAQCVWKYGIEHSHHPIIDHHHEWLVSFFEREGLVNGYYIWVCYDPQNTSEPDGATRLRCPITGENVRMLPVHILEEMRKHERIQEIR